MRAPRPRPARAAQGDRRRRRPGADLAFGLAPRRSRPSPHGRLANQIADFESEPNLEAYTPTVGVRILEFDREISHTAKRGGQHSVSLGVELWDTSGAPRRGLRGVGLGGVGLGRGCCACAWGPHTPSVIDGDGPPARAPAPAPARRPPGAAPRRRAGPNRFRGAARPARCAAAGDKQYEACWPAILAGVSGAILVFDPD